MQVKLSSLIRKLKLAIAKMWPGVQISYPWYPVSVTLQSWLSYHRNYVGAGLQKPSKASNASESFFRGQETVGWNSRKVKTVGKKRIEWEKVTKTRSFAASKPYLKLPWDYEESKLRQDHTLAQMHVPSHTLAHNSNHKNPPSSFSLRQVI